MWWDGTVSLLAGPGSVDVAGNSLAKERGREQQRQGVAVESQARGGKRSKLSVSQNRTGEQTKDEKTRKIVKFHTFVIIIKHSGNPNDS